MCIRWGCYKNPCLFICWHGINKIPLYFVLLCYRNLCTFTGESAKTLAYSLACYKNYCILHWYARETLANSFTDVLLTLLLQFSSLSGYRWLVTKFKNMQNSAVKIILRTPSEPIVLLHLSWLPVSSRTSSTLFVIFRCLNSSRKYLPDLTFMYTATRSLRSF